MPSETQNVAAKLYLTGWKTDEFVSANNNSCKVILICRLISKSNVRVAEIKHDRYTIFVKRIDPIRGYAFWKISCHISSLNARGSNRIEIKGNSVLGSSYSPYRNVTSPRYPYYRGHRVHLGGNSSTCMYI